MNLEMEEIPCPVCTIPGGVPLHREGIFQMVQCPSCRFVYLNPRPTDKALVSFYQHYLDESEHRTPEMMELVFQQASHLLGTYREKGRLLDVGAGFGFFLSAMEKRGWEVTGVDLSEEAIAYGRDVLRVNIRPGPLESAGFPGNHFDAVTGFYVIEHLPRPLAFLEECHRVLRPGGMILLRYPHTTPLKNLLGFFGIENRLYDLPAHLSDFSPETMQDCLEKAGFESCRHVTGGYTRPHELGMRTVSSLLGNLSEILLYLSRGRFLLPGVSKSILAFKGQDGNTVQE